MFTPFRLTQSNWIVVSIFVFLTTLGLFSQPTSAQTVVFSENFENNINNTATGAQDYDAFNGATQYVGTTPIGQTYTGSAAWIDGTNCNGIILSANNSTLPAWANGGTTNSGNKCNSAVGNQSYNALRTMARAMGIRFGGLDNNHVVSAYTECPGGTCTTIGSGPTNGVMFKTKSLIPVTPNHFYLFSVNAAAENCSSPGSSTIQPSDPQWQFQLFDASNTFTNVGGIIDVCGTGQITLSVTNLQTSPFPTSVNVYMQNLKATPILFSGNALGVQIYNNSGVTNGNDAAFDNVIVSDATPTLSKSFSPSSVSVGNTSTLTFTITNTADLQAKNGWSFTDTLPSGLVVASPAATTTCGSGTTVTAANGSGTVTVTGGNLVANAASCTVTVTVTATTAATYTNDASNITSSIGLYLPTNASVTFTPAPVLSVTKTSNGPWTIGQSGAAYTLTAANNGGSPTFKTTTVTDVLPVGVTANWAGTLSVTSNGINWNCTFSGQTVTCTTSNFIPNTGTNTSAITLPVTITAAALGTPVNYASIGGGGDTFNSGNAPTPGASCTDAGHCTSNTTPVVAPDLTIAKSHAGSFTRGSTGTYTLTVGNSGTSATTGTITAADTLPTGLSVNGGAAGAVTIGGANAANWTCNSNAASPQIVTCTSSAVIPASGTSIFTLDVNVATNAAATVTNTVSVSGGSEPTANNGNNTAADPTTTVATPPNIGLLKSCSSPANCTTVSQSPGTDLTYRIAYTNTGGQAATNMAILDAIPINTDYKLGSAAVTAPTGLTFVIEYSSDYNPANPSTATWTYTPVSAGGGATAGYDRLVKAIRWRVTSGTLSNVSPNNTGDVSFTTKIQ